MQTLASTDPTEVGPYRILGLLGQGDTGRSYLGRCDDGRLAAVKVLHVRHAADPAFQAQWTRAVARSRTVAAPWTAAVLDADPDCRTPWLATEYVAGLDLESAVRAHGPLDEEQTRVLGQRMCDALSARHARGILQHGPQPSDIVLAADGPRLVDPGIGRAISSAARTLVGVRPASPAFLSPEEVLGEPVEPASDVFCLAAVLVYACTGAAPFGDGPDHLAVARRIIGDHPDLTAVPTSLGRALQDCLAGQPAARPTAAHLRDGLGTDDDDGGWSLAAHHRWIDEF